MLHQLCGLLWLRTFLDYCAASVVWKYFEDDSGEYKYFTLQSNNNGTVGRLEIIRLT